MIVIIIICPSLFTVGSSHMMTDQRKNVRRLPRKIVPTIGTKIWESKKIVVVLSL